MADQLGQRDVIIVFDQAIYAKALEIVWQIPSNFSVWFLGWEHFIRFAPSLLQLARGSSVPARRRSD